MNKNELEQVRNSAVLLYDAQAVDRALDRMAQEITQTLGDQKPVVLCVLTGGIIPAGHILTRLPFLLEIDYVHATRYQGSTTGKDVRWHSAPGISLKGRVVLVLDDILDEGHTLQEVIDYCRQQQAERIYSAVLVEKQHERRRAGVAADFAGLQVDDRYVFGFGMDYRGYMRNLNAIYALNPQSMQGDHG
jgi:hypoxanthine phosphoribosyltransferase